jgi:DNA-binding NarL/FixJ family response regulator
VIADDHPTLRHGVTRILEHAAAPGYKVVAEADRASETIAAVRRLKPDALILDVSMPPDNGLDVLAECVDAHPELAAVVFTMHRELALARRAVAAGARGYVLKDAPATELLTALRLARRGATYLPPGIARSLVDQPPERPTVDLDLRERAILRRIALGYTGAEIASELGISERTVKNHRARVAGKLGLRHRRELTDWARRHGLLADEVHDMHSGLTRVGARLPGAVNGGSAAGGDIGPPLDHKPSPRHRQPYGADH